MVVSAALVEIIPAASRPCVPDERATAGLLRPGALLLGNPQIVQHDGVGDEFSRRHGPNAPQEGVKQLVLG